MASRVLVGAAGNMDPPAPPLLPSQMGKAVENPSAQLCPLSDVLVAVSTNNSGIQKGRPAWGFNIKGHRCACGMGSHGR